MASPGSITNSNNNIHETLPLFIRNSSTLDDIVVEPNTHTTSDTVVPVPGDVAQHIPSMASDRGDDGNRLTAVGSPLEGTEGAVAGDAKEGSRPRRIPLHRKLYDAAVEGDVKLLGEFLQSQDLKQLDGLSPLHGVTIGDNTVLHIAATSSRDLKRQCKGDYVNFAKDVYIRNRSLLMARNRLKETPLHCAAKAGNYKMVSLLISFSEHEHQVGVETLLTARNMHGETALHEAVRVGNRDIVNKLILSEPSLTGIVDDEGVSPLYLATMTNMLNIVKIFTREDSSTVSCAGPRGQTALHAAVLEHTEITRALLAWNKTLATIVDDLESTPLHYAVSAGNLAIVKLLLQYDTSAAYKVDKEGFFPIHIAAICGRSLLIKELIEQFPDSDELLDRSGSDFLHLAIKCRNGNIIDSIRHNHNFLRMLNARDNQGNTPLHLAGRSGVYGIVRFLISMKMVCSSIMNRDGLTPVDLAIKERDQGFSFVLSTKFNVLRCLMWTGALPSPHRFDYFSNDFELPSSDKKKEIEKFESIRRGLGIISVLIATVTFAASFTVPGGYIAVEEVNRGTPILSGKYTFKAFIVADTLAFLLSIFAASLLAYTTSPSIDFKHRAKWLELSMLMMEIAARATLCAFALAIYTMLYQVDLPISIMVIVATFGLISYSNQANLALLLLATPIVMRVGWKGLFDSHLRLPTIRRIDGVLGLGRKFTDFVIFYVLWNISLFGLIFLLALF